MSFFQKCFSFLPKADLASTRESMERRESEYEEVSSQLALKSETEERLQRELESLKTDLARLREAEEMLQRSVTSKERKVGHLEERLAELQDARNKRSDSVSLSIFDKRWEICRKETEIEIYRKQIDLIFLSSPTKAPPPSPSRRHPTPNSK